MQGANKLPAHRFQKALKSLINIYIKNHLSAAPAALWGAETSEALKATHTAAIKNCYRNYWP